MTDEDDAVEAFERLGLTGYEAKAFLALQELGSGTASDVARVADVPRSQVYGVAESLEERGLVEVQQSTPRRFRAVSIDRARETLRERLEAEQERAFGYAEEVRDAAGGDAEQEAVWTVRGHRRVLDRTLDHVAGATDRIHFAARLPEFVPDELRDALGDRAADGVDVAVVSSTDGVRERFADAPGVRVVEPPAPHAEEDRSGRIVVADDDRVLLSVVDDDGRETAISSAESLFAQVLVELIDAGGVLERSGE